MGRKPWPQQTAVRPPRAAASKLTFSNARRSAPQGVTARSRSPALLLAFSYGGGRCARAGSDAICRDNTWPARSGRNNAAGRWPAACGRASRSPRHAMRRDALPGRYDDDDACGCRPRPARQRRTPRHTPQEDQRLRPARSRTLAVRRQSWRRTGSSQAWNVSRTIRRTRAGAPHRTRPAWAVSLPRNRRRH